MRRDPTASLLARWRLGRPTAEPEPADLGTAYGLEMSLQPPPSDVAAPVPLEQRHRGWLERMRLRLS
jgi:hypothetical protein